MGTFKASLLLSRLGISPETITDRHLSPYSEADSLELAEVGHNGREHYLVPMAMAAWKEMKQSAARDGEDLYIVSAFRSIARQTEIIEDKLAQGLDIDEILMICAPPGYSEHHTGRALDLATPDVESLSEDFEKSSTFNWLKKNAGRFNFHLSYPRDNESGYQYEPWHWYYR